MRGAIQALAVRESTEVSALPLGWSRRSAPDCVPVQPISDRTIYLHPRPLVG
jgi:hypothetical protein